MRSTLRSLSFFKEDSVLPVELMEMLAYYQNMRVNGVPVLDYTYEIYEAYVDGRVNKRTNILAFVRGIQDNTAKVESKKQAKVKHFITEDADENDDLDGVNINSIETPKDGYAVYEDSDELTWAVNKIKSLKMEMCIDFSVNLEMVLQKAAHGFKPAKETLIKMCKEVDLVADLVNIILSSGKPILELFPENCQSELLVSDC